MKDRNRIFVPQRTIQGGFDLKFETDPYDIDLKGILTSEQYTDAITTLNDRLRPSRSGVIDKALLITGPLIVPLALWGFRHSNQTRRRKRLLKKGIEEFNTLNPSLLMRWNRKPVSCLTIELKPQQTHPMVQAQIVAPGIIEAEPEIPLSAESTSNDLV